MSTSTIATLNQDPTLNETRYILVTGSDGLLGWHVRVFLSTQSDVVVIPCNRSQFADDEYLQNAVAKANAVIHLAGVNQGNDAEIEANPAIAQRLIDACTETDSRPYVLYGNSTHCDRDTVFGRAKQAVADLFSNWAEKEDARFCNFVLPHVFGEHGKPFCNSVVSTFCHQIATGEEPSITGDGDLELLHTLEAAKIFWQAIDDGTVGNVRPQGAPVKVSELLDRLKTLSIRYRDGVIPNLDNPLDLQLFNTYRSYLPHDHRPIDLTVWSDERGGLFEGIRADGKGQVFLSTTRPGITRGNHFHLHKVERFLVVQGNAKIRLRKALHDDVHVFEVSGDNPQAIDIPTLHAHSITNVGHTPVLTLFWASEHFDRDNPDTYALEVQSGETVQLQDRVAVK